jgi:hypothetical protein
MYIVECQADFLISSGECQTESVILVLIESRMTNAKCQAQSSIFTPE